MRALAITLALVPSAALGQPAEHCGATFELNAGIEVENGNDGRGHRVPALAGDLGVGGWLRSDLALTGRIATVQLRQGVLPIEVSSFIGPSVQYWPSRHVWLGGGMGLATIEQLSSGGCTDCPAFGLGFDARVGYTFNSARHTINLSLELTPGLYIVPPTGSAGGLETLTGVAFLLGYQYL
jgi:hypothetical protein